MRKRFTQIDIKNTNIDGNQIKIPVGAQATNITFLNGSILEEAFGDLAFQTKGSVQTQLNNLSNRLESDEAKAPIVRPFFQEGVFLRRYGKQNIIYNMPHSVNTATLRNVNIVYNINTDDWGITGTVSSGIDTAISLYGSDQNDLLKSGTYNYKVTVKNNTSSEEDTSYIHLVWSADEGYNIANGDFNITQGTEGEFTIPENMHLTKIDYVIPLDLSDVYINKTLKIQLFDNNDILANDKYHTVFDIQQNQITKTWKTTVAENFTVSPGLQGQAKSILGTIYNTKWAGPLNILRTDSQNASLLIQDSGVGFQLTELESLPGDSIQNKILAQNNFNSELKEATPYRIFTSYIANGDGARGGLIYDSNDFHRFRINGTNIATIDETQVILSKPLSVTSKITAQHFYSPDVPIFIRDMKSLYQLEQVIKNSVDYPRRHALFITFSTQFCAQLLSSTNSWKNSPTGTWSAIGLGYKTSEWTITLLLFGTNNKIYRAQYGWGNAGNVDKPERYKKVTSVTLGTTELNVTGCAVPKNTTSTS